MNPFEVFRKTLSVVRAGLGSMVDFEWVDGTPTLFDITASVQPSPAEVLETLPEGDRTKESYLLFTDTELRTAKTNEYNSDTVIINGDEYTVVKVAPWSNQIISHYEVVVLKRDS